MVVRSLPESSVGGFGGSTYFSIAVYLDRHDMQWCSSV